MNPEKMAVAAIKTILTNAGDEPTKEDWKAIMDIAKAHAKFHYVKARNTDYHVRHGKLAKGKGNGV